MKKQFVLDTNVLLHNPECILGFEDNDVVLPMEVIEELDRFKRHADERGRNARSVIRTLDTLRENGNLGKGITIDGGGNLTLQGNGTSTVVRISGGDIELRNMAIRGGAPLGAGIDNSSALRLRNITVSGNSGGIVSVGPVTLIDSEIVGNSASFLNGSILGAPGALPVTIELIRTTVSENGAGLLPGIQGGEVLLTIHLF